MVPLAKDKCLNFKVDEFFYWLWHIWKEAWILAKGFLLDKQTVLMKGKSEYETRCGKFKRLSDGLQGDCIADDGYTWYFYLRNEPCNPELLAQGYSPMHCRILHMFMNLSLATGAQWITSSIQLGLLKLPILCPTLF